MNVGLFTDTFLPIVDGVGRVVLSYAETLSALGHQVTVSAPLYDTGFRGGFPYDLIDYAATVRVPTAPQYRTGSPILDPHYRKRMAMTQLDIVHVHSPFSAGSEGLRIARERHIPIVATFHSKYYDDFYKVTQNETLSRMMVSAVVAFFNRCDQVWAVGESTAEVLRSYGYRKNIVVMPNGVKFRSADGEQIRKIEAEYHLGSLPMLLFVGQINWKKNILRVLEAAAELKKSGVAFRLLLAGQGPDKKAVEEKIRELLLDDTATLIGHISDMNVLDALYARASVFTFPSLYDNAPMVVREAAVMGTPAVMVAGSSAAEIVHDGENGFLCRDSSLDLFRVLQAALSHPEKTKAIGLAAQNTIPVSWESIMQDAVRQYQYLIDHPSPRTLRARKHKMP